MDFDKRLLNSLLALPPTHAHIYEAIVEFNQANTDSSDVPPHVEAVMCKSAYEWLLQIDSSMKSFTAALEKRLADTWFKRWQHESKLALA